ncbi:unnamed protein product, partial [Polarella glacialis]
MQEMMDPAGHNYNHNNNDNNNDVLRQAFLRGAGKEPWRHQVAAVEALLSALKGHASHESNNHNKNNNNNNNSNGSSNLLVQHGAGSGKSLTMALLAWALRNLITEASDRVVLVLLLSDRV